MPRRNYYRKARNPWPFRIVMALMLATFVFAAVKLGIYIVQQRQTAALHAELSELVAEEALEPAESLPASTEIPDSEIRTEDEEDALLPTLTVDVSQQPEILEAYRALWRRNNDMVGWLQMDALYRVDFPVVQRDQTYYLRRDFDGNNSSSGTAFLDEACCIWPRDDNLIIYAHNMKNGSMFGELHKLMQEIAYKEAPLTIFNTIYERGVYVPVAAFLCTITPGERFFNFTVRNFKTQEAFDDFIAKARALSAIEPPYDVAYGDDLLTLVTCYDDDGDQRMVVILRRMRDDEDMGVLRTMWQ